MLGHIKYLEIQDVIDKLRENRKKIDFCSAL